jgi:phage terminase large subunit-like protein
MAQININLPTMYTKQLEVFTSIVKSTERYHTINGSRQIGKSKLIAILGIYLALLKADQQIMVLSQTDATTTELQKVFLDMINNAPIMKSYKIQASKQEITFSNGTDELPPSKILFRSANLGDALRGYSLNHILADEAAYFEQGDVVGDIVAPAMNVKGKGGKIIFASTPCGSNYFRGYYMRGKMGEKNYKSYDIRYTDNPYSDLVGIANVQQVAPKALFDQEYNLVFTDSTSVFSMELVDELSIMEPQKDFTFGNSYYTGVDIGMQQDFTTIVTFNQKREMVDMRRFTDCDSPYIRAQIKNVVDIFSPRRLMIESNGIGYPIITDLRAERVHNIEEFFTTTDSKSKIINNMINSVAKKEVKLLNDADIKSEFKSFVAKLKNGKVLYEASFGAHDDIVMGSCLALEALSGFIYKPLKLLKI